MAEVQVNGAVASPEAGGQSAADARGGADQGARPGRKHSRKGTTVAFVILAIVIVAVAGYLLLRTKSTGSAAEHPEVEPTLNLDTFVVNLEGGNQRAYLRVGISLGLSRPLARKEDVPVAALRDTVVSVLSSAQPDQLLRAEGKQKIKDQLLQALQERAPDLGIENVYFTEFLVQI